MNHRDYSLSSQVLFQHSLDPSPPPHRTSSLLITHHIGRHTNDDNQQRGPRNAERKDWNRERRRRRRRKECPHVDAWSTAGSVSYNKNTALIFIYSFLSYLPFTPLHFVFTSLSASRWVVYSASDCWQRCTLRYRHRLSQVYVVSSFTFSPPPLLPPMSFYHRLISFQITFSSPLLPLLISWCRSLEHSHTVAYTFSCFVLVCEMWERKRRDGGKRQHY